MKEHTEIPVSVNAWVDAGVADLVTALNEFDSSLITLESCEGSRDSPTFVYFVHRDGTDDSLTTMVARLVGVLDEVLSCRVRLRLEWSRPVGAMAEFLVSKMQVKQVARALSGRRVVAYREPVRDGEGRV